MKGIIYSFFGLSIVLFLGMAHYFLASQRPGAYPPKYLLRKRSTTLAIGGVLFLSIGLLLLMFK
ncbi:hypothetical protein ACFSO7_03820 [Bacillus sp. CGMCC 1.16607]|uniref:hypothetical protein n=1 Tax=Bacillus sp. CGMCC 1.16607 TaxID=3351842 RepID=UPI0036379669